MKFTLRYFAALAGVIACSSAASAAYIFTGADISENFDSLPTTTTTTGAFSATVGSLSSIGTTGFVGTRLGGSGNVAVNLTVDTGASSSGGLFSYGASSGASDRALGAVASGTNFMGFGFELVNSTGALLETITISFTQETWRTSTSVANTLSASYSSGAPSSTNFLTATTGFTAVTALDIVGPAAVATNGAIDGNANQVSRTFTFTGLSVAAGDSLYLRWQDVNDAGSDAGLAIDDLVISAVPEPACALLGAFGLLGILRRRR